ncbi:hypothetical protein GUITHDRAFT_110537 [Guillardia theta CCMP2712]|uniref:ABC transmembrane type-1 domain-containing protein n=1 Tax=Guillardia theta (strain CCMP2712) TaxID=905079 RepID=L1J5L4_GUITC|nr:hypothetical protein GUITHDRAFT_110537 [Guillardia theta CCMP2712]EKX43414.1 hypothetical protein GUITHDRAFT_110537 [Guillardia theta CCMP2712]|eukprot:XP_005830394.1 hypothetical protein GUITHDRAFT_110537 [Guillardia theta CCMP2712]
MAGDVKEALLRSRASLSDLRLDAAAGKKTIRKKSGGVTLAMPVLMSARTEGEVTTWTLVLSTIRKSPSSTFYFCVITSVCLAKVALVASTAGSILGAFYKTLLAKDLAAFATNCVKALASHSHLVCLPEESDMRSIEILAARWRLELTSQLQRMYFDGRKRILSKLVDCSRKHSLGLPDGLVEKLDNIDQRLVNDAKLLCDTISRIVLQIITAPVSIAVYVILSLRAVGWVAPVAISGFFLSGLLINHLLARSVEKRVAQHQRLEGDFRLTHKWTVDMAQEISMSKGVDFLREITHNNLVDVYNVQLKVASRHWFLNMSSNMFMYFGSIVNYLIIAIAVFASSAFWTFGSVSGIQSDDSSTFASNISQASFNTLALCEGFSLMIQASVDIGDARGYAK